MKRLLSSSLLLFSFVFAAGQTAFATTGKIARPPKLRKGSLVRLKYEEGYEGR